MSTPRTEARVSRRRAAAEWATLGVAVIAGAVAFNLGQTPFFRDEIIEEEVVVPPPPGADCAWHLDLQRHRCRFRLAGAQPGWAHVPSGDELMAPYRTRDGKTMLLGGFPDAATAEAPPKTLRCQLRVRGRVAGFAARWSADGPWEKVGERTWMAEVVSCRAP